MSIPSAQTQTYHPPQPTVPAPMDGPAAPQPAAQAPASAPATANAPGAPAPDANPATPDAPMPRYQVATDQNVISATDKQTGDVIAYARQTKSYLVKDGATGVSIYGFGNGSFGVQDATDANSATISAAGDATAVENGKTVALGKITDPAVLTALAQIFGSKAAADISIAVKTKDLEKTSVGATFPYQVVNQLAAVQGQDNLQMVQKSLPPAQLAAMQAQQQMASQPIVPAGGGVIDGSADDGGAADGGGLNNPSAMMNPYMNGGMGMIGNPYMGGMNPYMNGGMGIMGNPYMGGMNPYMNGGMGMIGNPYLGGMNPYGM